MSMRRIGLLVAMTGLCATAGCSDDGGGNGDVDTSGACGVICEGGSFDCTIDGFDPNDGLEACTRACQSEWTNEQDARCVGEASFVLDCVDANGSCDTLDAETCGAAATDLIECARTPSGAGGSGGTGGRGGASMIDFSVQAFSISVRDACDGPGNEGDFFITVRLRDDTNEEVVLIDESRENLVQSSGGITSLDDRNILAEGAVRAVTGTRILVGTSIFENDPEGPQASIGLNTAYEYDADEPCWRVDGEDECLGPEGELDVIVLDLRDNTGDVCDVELRSRVSAGPPE